MARSATTPASPEHDPDKAEPQAFVQRQKAAQAHSETSDLPGVGPREHPCVPEKRYLFVPARILPQYEGIMQGFGSGHGSSECIRRTAWFLLANDLGSILTLVGGLLESQGGVSMTKLLELAFAEAGKLTPAEQDMLASACWLN